ncbi:MAG: hypothetical protein AAF228_07030 [Pseudomonadota bacterium]
MRCLLIFFVSVFFAGCSLEPTATTHLTKGETSNVSLLSTVNNQLHSAQSKSAGQTAFHNCIAANQFKNANTLTTFLYSTNRDSSAPLIVTVDSGVLSAYINQIWNLVQQDPEEMRNTILRHKTQDNKCFSDKLTVMNTAATSSQADATKQKTSNLEDYRNSAKLVLDMYDYLDTTLQKTEYAELSEQLARDHIPIRVLLPTS